MRDFVSTFIPCRVQIEGLTYRVRPATLREALVIMAAMEDDWEEVKRICYHWLPLPLASVLFVRNANHAETLRGIGQLLSVGVRNQERHKQDERAVKKKAHVIGWTEIMAEYQTTFGRDPLDEPWPLFIAMCPEIWKMQAREQLRNAAWYAGAKMGQMDDILERTGWNQKEDFEMPESMKDPEWHDSEMRKARALWKQKKGEA